MSPLHLSARNGNVELTQFFLKKKLTVNIRDKYLKTPLHYACEFFQYDVVELLLSNGAKPTDRDHRGWTALHYAIQSNDAEIITQILKKDTNMVHFVDYGRRSPLHMAVMQRKDNTKIVDLLMRHGADR
jgi:ankyrin repeat protein